jgi:hypothetical protein
MALTAEMIAAPRAPEELTRGWQALCAEPTFEDIAARIEPTAWGTS